MKGSLAVAALVVATLGGADAAAQEITIQSPPAAREPRVIPPGLHYETTRPSDASSYPDGTRVRHDPAFIEPLSGRTQTPRSTGRAGLSGWTSPNTPVGSTVTGRREVTGWLGFGFSMTWGGPLPPGRRGAAPPLRALVDDAGDAPPELLVEPGPRGPQRLAR